MQGKSRLPSKSSFQFVVHQGHWCSAVALRQPPLAECTVSVPCMNGTL